jgi:catechol 2,3-dioxygenase-like lactoylglutathione lyase family enzyme
MARHGRAFHLLFAVMGMAILGSAMSTSAAENDRKTGGNAESVGPVLWQPSMNVFRRFPGDAEPMYAFYRDILGLEQLETLNPSGSGGVARFQLGEPQVASQIKLNPRVPDESYEPGGVKNATGLRLLTLYYPDAETLAERFEAHGREAPEFRPLPNGKRKVAVVDDPSGQPVQLIVAPDAPKETYDRLEIGLTVSDLAESRRFYGDFVGLEELPPEKDPVFDTMKYPYRNGSTTINLRHFGDDLPRDTGSGGIQYVVSNAALVDRLAKARDITIEQPLNTLKEFSLTTIWLEDPDGITNYFAETQQSRQAQSASAAA